MCMDIGWFVSWYVKEENSDEMANHKDKKGVEITKLTGALQKNEDVNI